MKRFLCFLSICVAFATPTIRAADDGAPASQPTAVFQAAGSQVTGTVALPPGQCVYGGFRSDMWQGYMWAFSFAPKADLPLDALTFSVDASINRPTKVSRETDHFLKVAGGWKLVTPKHDPAWKFSLVGEMSAHAGVGTEVPEKPRSITLNVVYNPAQTAGQAAPVATWTIAYPGTRKADVITLDLWTGTDRDEIAAKIQTRNTTKPRFAEVHAHLFD